LEEGRYAQFESERTLTAQYPKKEFEELLKQAKAEGKEYIEFTANKLREMSLEKHAGKVKEPSKEA
jgi:hypothetical protein